MKLIILKARPLMVLGLLQCIKENTGNAENLKNCIHSHLWALSSKKKERNIRSDVYGVALPTLRKLNLITGQGRFLKLNSNGKLLLKSFSKGGIDEFKHQFGRLLFEIDERKCKVISSLSDLIGAQKFSAVPYELLIKSLNEKGLETGANDERLRKWIPFLEFVNLVALKDKNFQLNLLLLEEFKIERFVVKFDAFEEAFFMEYDKLENSEGIYVPIHTLSEMTCSQINENENYFTTFDFERYFALLLRKYSSLEKKKILLSQPGKREEEGIYIDNTYYYFVSIYDVKEAS